MGMKKYTSMSDMRYCGNMIDMTHSETPLQEPQPIDGIDGHAHSTVHTSMSALNMIDRTHSEKPLQELIDRTHSEKPLQEHPPYIVAGHRAGHSAVRRLQHRAACSFRMLPCVAK